MSVFYNPTKRSGKDMTDNLLKEIACLEHELEFVKHENRSLRRALKLIEHQYQLLQESSLSSASTCNYSSARKKKLKSGRFLRSLLKTPGLDDNSPGESDLDQFPTRLQQDGQQFASRMRLMKLVLDPSSAPVIPPVQRKLWKNSCSSEDWRMSLDKIYQTKMQDEEPDSGRDSGPSSLAEVVTTDKPETEVIITYTKESDETEPVTPCESFDDMKLKAKVLGILSGYGFMQPTTLQRWAVLPCVSGRSTVISAPSGRDAGKKLISIIASFQVVDWKIKKCQVIILMATRDSASHFFKFFETCGRATNISSHLCIGGTDVREEMQKIRNENPQIIVATPGRILDLMNRSQSRGNFNEVKLIIVNQGHILLNTQFREMTDKIFNLLPENVQTIISTPEATEQVLDKAESGDFIIFKMTPTKMPHVSRSCSLSRDSPQPSSSSSLERSTKSKEARLEQIACDKQQFMQTLQHFYLAWKKPGNAATSDVLAKKCLSVFETMRETHAVVFSEQSGFVGKIAKIFKEKNHIVYTMTDTTKSKSLPQVLREFFTHDSSILVTTSKMVKKDSHLVKGIVPVVINADVGSSAEIFFRRCQVSTDKVVTLLRATRTMQMNILKGYEKTYGITIKELLRFPPIAWNKPIQLPKD